VAEGKEKSYLDLRAKAQRTPEEDDQFASIQETINARRGDISKLATEIEQEYLGKRSDAQMSLVSTVRDIIKKVGEEQKFDLVVDGALVFYASEKAIDLTPAVVAELNKGQEDTEN
jgi:Skp family chaperone for outer membrane proteins